MAAREAFLHGSKKQENINIIVMCVRMHCVAGTVITGLATVVVHRSRMYEYYEVLRVQQEVVKCKYGTPSTPYCIVVLQLLHLTRIGTPRVLYATSYDALKTTVRRSYSSTHRITF
jgi:hypothetical protein